MFEKKNYQVARYQARRIKKKLRLPINDEHSNSSFVCIYTLKIFVIFAAI
jgi:hypothetical protein